MLKERLFVTVNNSGTKGKEEKVMVISIIMRKRERETEKKIRRKTAIGFSLYKKESKKEVLSLSVSSSM